MPKTATQRSKDYRERIKSDSALHAAQKEKERERWKIRAAKLKTAVRTPGKEKEKKGKEKLNGEQAKKIAIFHQKMHLQVIRILLH